MTYIIAEPCIDIKDRSCVDVCPVDCIHEAARILVIDPEECIDCGACEPECPVEAIFPEDALPDKWEPFVRINYAYGEGIDVVDKLVDDVRRPSTTSRTRRSSRGLILRAAGRTSTDSARRRLEMPQQAWSEKRKRQYEHIKDSARERGESEDRAEEIAARTVNKERARAGEARESSRLSREDVSSGRRGGRRSGTSRQKGRTRDQLYAEAKRMGIEGRSRMNKAQLQRAVEPAEVAR